MDKTKVLKPGGSLMQFKSIAECSGEHSAILFTYIKRLLVLKSLLLVFFEWPLKTGFPVSVTLYQIWWQLSYHWFWCIISTALEYMFCLIILIQSITTTIKSRTVLTHLSLMEISLYYQLGQFISVLRDAVWIFHICSNFDRQFC